MQLHVLFPLGVVVAEGELELADVMVVPTEAEALGAVADAQQVAMVAFDPGVVVFARAAVMDDGRAVVLPADDASGSSHRYRVRYLGYGVGRVKTSKNLIYKGV
jgi:hypothetical protein